MNDLTLSHSFSWLCWEDDGFVAVAEEDEEAVAEELDAAALPKDNHDDIK